MRYRFGEFTMDLDRFELRRGERPVEIQPKSFDVLRYLVKNADRTVPKEELLDTVWSGIAVGEAALTQAVRQARVALGEAGDGDAIIATVRRRGYGMGVPVSDDDEAAAPEPPQPEAASTADAPVVAPSRPRRGLVAAGVAAALALLAWLARPIELPAPAIADFDGSMPADRSAIAVLPFADLSLRHDQQHLADGLAIEILNALSKNPALRVAARTSSFAFRESGEDVRTIAEQLGVGVVIEGSVRRQSDRLRITAQLIDAKDGFHLWSESYDGAASDSFGVQRRIAQAISDRLGGGDGNRPRASSDETVAPDPLAYDALMLGRSEMSLRTRESIERGIARFERALEIDPTYAVAHAELAQAHMLLRDFGGHHAVSTAEMAAVRALELDPAEPLALTVLGQVRSQQGDLEVADEILRRVVEANPGDVNSMEHYAAFLAYRGQAHESARTILRALELDPLSALLQRQAGRFLLYTGETDRAIAHLLRSLELNPSEPYAPSLLWMAYKEKGWPAEAREALVRLAPAWSRPALRAAGNLFGSDPVIALGLAPARWIQPPCTGRPDSAIVLYAYVGDADRLFECLGYIVDEGRDLGYVKLNPVFDRYRADPGFGRILRRAGLE